MGPTLLNLGKGAEAGWEEWLGKSHLSQMVHGKQSQVWWRWGNAAELEAVAAFGPRRLVSGLGREYTRCTWSFM